MTRDVRKAVGRPDNSAFIRRCICYGIILAVMLFVAPTIFTKIMVPMAANGMTMAWYAVFVPLMLVMMAVGLFRCWRRRWPLAYMGNYQHKARACNYTNCPRCGAPFVLKRRTRFSRQKVGEIVTTTTYTDGSKTVDTKGVYENVKRTDTYHQCSNPRCALEAEQHISQSHLPWRNKQIRCLVLNDGSLLGAKHSSAHDLLLSRLLVPVLALVVIVVCGATICTYANAHDGEWTYVTADKESNRSADDYQTYLLSLDTENPNWYMTYEKEPSDMLSYLGNCFLKQDRTVGYSMGGYAVEGGQVLTYRFEGDDAGTGIPDGWYTLTELDGINVLIDDTNEKIYKQGTEFYDTYAPKLLALSHDQALGVILAKVDGGEHALSGSNDFWLEFIRKDDTMVYAYMLSQDVSKISGGEFRAVTTHPEELVTETWIFTYNDYEYTPDDLEGYVYSDAAPSYDDELGKLIEKSSDGSGSYELYRNDELVVEIDIDTLANGYEFSFDRVEAGFDKDFEEDVVYRVNTNTKTLTKIVTDEHYNETESDMPLSEHQDKYDFLLSIVPEIYIRNIIDMDKAEVKNENLGLSKNYIMKDENGNMTAEMKVAFGKIGEVIHHTAEGEYVKIELAY